jgi:hypothetical protein
MKETDQACLERNLQYKEELPIEVKKVYKFLDEMKNIMLKVILLTNQYKQSAPTLRY